MMARGRSKTTAICPVQTCRRQFYPWLRKRTGVPTCSVRCARQMTGLSQRGKQLTAATAGRKQHARRRLEALCMGEFGPFTDRERLIFLRGFQAGYDRAYPKTWRKQGAAA